MKARSLEAPKFEIIRRLSRGAWMLDPGFIERFGRFNVWRQIRNYPTSIAVHECSIPVELFLFWPLNVLLRWNITLKNWQEWTLLSKVNPRPPGAQNNAQNDDAKYDTFLQSCGHGEPSRMHDNWLISAETTKLVPNKIPSFHNLKTSIFW